jgi:hypothetical protein
MKDKRKPFTIIFYDKDVAVRKKLVENFDKKSVSTGFKVVPRRAKSMNVLKKLLKQSSDCRVVVSKDLAAKELDALRNIFYSFARKGGVWIQGIFFGN